VSVWTWPDAEVVRVVDGDTLDMRVTKVSDIGFGFTQSATVVVRLRLNRINAPALSTVAGKASAAYVASLLPVGTRVPLQTVKPYKYGGPGDSPGEWMAEVTSPAGGNVSDLMVSNLLAVYWDGSGPRPAEGK
jgi:endonuclease YncB( thermonuclease family)